MSVTKLFLLLIVFILVDGEAFFWRRRSRRRRRCPRVDCRSYWKAWSPCACNGKRYRDLVITAHPRCGGHGCPAPRQVVSCHKPIKHCRTIWRSWSTCSCQGYQLRSTVNTQVPACGGTPCPVRVRDTRKCIPTSRKDCAVSWGNWSPCNCNGLTIRHTVIRQHSKCGGTRCPVLASETKSCVPTTRKNCAVSWANWLPCSCDGLKTRHTAIKQQPICGGIICPTLVKETKSCVPKDRRDCSVSWGNWSLCSCDGSTTRSTVINQHPKCGGTRCPAIASEIKSCVPKDRMNCSVYWGNWSACSCDGLTTRATLIKQHQKCGGTRCPVPEGEIKSCVPTTRENCAVSWGNWSLCSCDGLTTRPTVINQQPKCGGTICPILVNETTHCIPNNRMDCSVSWGNWSSCSCDGSTTRTTVINQHPNCGGTRCPVLTNETKLCVPKDRMDCTVSWGHWSSCSCDGSTTRTTVINQHSKCGGIRCPAPTNETKSCVPTTRKNCAVSWGNWSSCSCDGLTTRPTVIKQQPKCGGTICPTLVNETTPCIPKNRIHCSVFWGNWSSCSCDGLTTRATLTNQHPKCGGTRCPAPTSETKLCVPTTRKNCAVSWGNWSSCSCDGLATRPTVIEQQPKCGGTVCPIHVNETKSCVPKDRRDCSVSWGNWSSCTCNGLTTRSTVTNQRPKCGGTRCPPLASETISCVPTTRKNCSWSWGVWSSCTCRGNQDRRMSITQIPKCGGNICPMVQTQSRKCASSFCVPGGGRCVPRNNTAVCRCIPGKTGLRCEKNCPSGTYDFNCTKRCNCKSGISCDRRDGFCKCPVGRSGRRCQFRYKCAKGSKCSIIQNPRVNYRICFIQTSVSYISRQATTTCPVKTHYANRCICHPNCLPSSLYKSRRCRCKCRSDKHDRFITTAICCPKHPYF